MFSNFDIQINFHLMLLYPLNTKNFSLKLFIDWILNMYKIIYNLSLSKKQLDKLVFLRMTLGENLAISSNCNLNLINLFTDGYFLLPSGPIPSPKQCLKTLLCQNCKRRTKYTEDAQCYTFPLFSVSTLYEKGCKLEICCKHFQQKLIIKGLYIARFFSTHRTFI